MAAAFPSPDSAFRSVQHLSLGLYLPARTTGTACSHLSPPPSQGDKGWTSVCGTSVVPRGVPSCSRYGNRVLQTEPLFLTSRAPPWHPACPGPPAPCERGRVSPSYVPAAAPSLPPPDSAQPCRSFRADKSLHAEYTLQMLTRRVHARPLPAPVAWGTIRVGALGAPAG